MLERTEPTDTKDDKFALAKLHRDWLRSLPGMLGISLSAIADEVKIARTTLTDKIKPDDPGTSLLHGATVSKIVRKFGVAPPGEAVPQTALRRMPKGFAEEAAPYDAGGETPLAQAVAALIAGRDHVMPVTLLTRAIEGAGYLPGDILIYDLNGAPSLGGIVRAQVYDRNGEIEETVWRLFDPPFLVGLSRDPAVTPKPLIVDNIRVVVMGTVIGMVRPSTVSAAA